MADIRQELEKIGLINIKNIYRNMGVAALAEQVLLRGEGELLSTGALAVKTGKYTGRSPKDRFFADTPDVHDKIKWGGPNVPIEPEKYEKLLYRLTAFLETRDVFVFEGFVGADPAHRIPVRVINQYAWQNLFIRQLLVRPKEEELVDFVPEFNLICAPGFKALPEVDGTNSEAFVILNYQDKKIIIGGTSYAGEMKKSCFTWMNFLLPDREVLPMHCSANEGDDGQTALFFGLSGTGKTTLSADTSRNLIGDDEHGWSEDGIFNFEGGCYAKCINLTREGEPQIWDAIRFGSVAENVVYDQGTRVPDYFDGSITENTRVSYPLQSIPNAVESGIGGHPKTIVFLTADAFGVLPPIAKLNVNEACYQFLSGYTSKLAGTERGITEPQATFSTCFGAPFLPRPAFVYANMLSERILKYNPDVHFLNTGWTGGPYGVGSRMKLSYSRAMVTAALTGGFDDVEFVYNPIFGCSVPKSCPGVPDEILDPMSTWADKDAYLVSAKKLAALFQENFAKFVGLDQAIIAAGPNPDRK